MTSRTIKTSRARKSGTTAPMPTATRLSPDVDLIITRMQAEFGGTRETVIEEAFTHYAGFLEKLGWLTYEPNGLRFDISRPSVVRQ